jgi:dipeptide/tripeptide permease
VRLIELQDLHEYKTSVVYQLIHTICELKVQISASELAYTEAPKTMKSIFQAVFWIYDYFGNLIVVLISLLSIRDQVYEYSLSTILMLVATLVLTKMSTSYKTAEVDEASSTTETRNNN